MINISRRNFLAFLGATAAATQIPFIDNFVNSFSAIEEARRVPFEGNTPICFITDEEVLNAPVGSFWYNTMRGQEAVRIMGEDGNWTLLRRLTPLEISDEIWNELKMEEGRPSKWIWKSSPTTWHNEKTVFVTNSYQHSLTNSTEGGPHEVWES